MLIEAVGVSRTYDGPPPVEAVRGVDLGIGAEEHVAIMGASGSGKSTLLNLLGLLDRPTSGNLRLAGHDIGDLGERQRTTLRASLVGFVFQQFHLLADRSARENVALALTIRGVGRAERLRRATEALDRVGLAHRAGATARQLSGGEQQRVAIARAIIGGPTLLLADEPTGNLDTSTGRDILDAFDRLHDDGQAVVVVTHDRATARRADRLLSMRDGCLRDGRDGDLP